MASANDTWADRLESVPKVVAEPVKLEGWRAKRRKVPVPIDWVVEKMLAGGDVTIIASEGGLGKSWFAAHIAEKVANGEPVCGELRTDAGNALWIDNENGPDENDRRCRSLDKNVGLQEVRFMEHDVYFHEETWQASEEGIATLARTIDDLVPRLVVLDSLVSIYPEGVKENEAGDIRKVMDALTGALRRDSEGRKRERPPACLILHHTRKGEGEGGWPEFRGSSDIRNACSFMLIMRPVEYDRPDGTVGRHVEFKWTKCRRGRSPDKPMRFRLEAREADTPDEWVEFVPMGESEGKAESLERRLLTTLEGSAGMSLKELAEVIVGFPKDARTRTKLFAPLITSRIIVANVGKGPREPTIYALKPLG